MFYHYIIIIIIIIFIKFFDNSSNNSSNKIDIYSIFDNIKFIFVSKTITLFF